MTQTVAPPVGGGRSWLWLVGGVVLFLAIALVGVFLVFLPIRSTTSTGGAPQITEAWARAAGKGDTSAIYLVVTNPGSADRILSVKTDVAEEAELHRSEMQDGVMRMREVEAIDVPAGGEVRLQPGGLHVMLTDLERDLHEGDEIAFRLRFEKAGEIALKAPVRPPTAPAPTRH